MPPLDKPYSTSRVPYDTCLISFVGDASTVTAI